MIVKVTLLSSISINQPLWSDIHCFVCGNAQNCNFKLISSLKKDQKITWMMYSTADCPYTDILRGLTLGPTSAITTKQQALIINVWRWCLIENDNTTMLWRVSFVKQLIDLQWCRQYHYHVGAWLGVVWSGLTLHSPVCWERAPSLLHFNNK